MSRKCFLASLAFKLSLSSALITVACAAPGFRLAPVSQSGVPSRDGETEALNRFAQGAFERLPARTALKIPETLEVRWDPKAAQSLSAAQAAKLFCAPEGAVHSLARMERHDALTVFYLHPALKPAVEVEGREIPAPCSPHKDLKRLAQAALAHQVAHRFAQDASVSRELEAEFKLSIRSAVLAIDTDRAPDSFEARDATERFAVNFEYFALDPEYACRRPFEARRMEERTGSPRHFAAMGAPACAPDWRISLEKGGLAEISPEQVREIRYLMIEPGAPLSAPRERKRAGHAMLQLVRCFEGDSACDRDLVISLRSNIQDPVLETLNGLSGTEPARVRVYRYADIVSEYAFMEMRGLRSATLDLDRGARERLVALLLERFWADNGLLAAGGRDMSGEVRDLLKAALGPSHPLWKSMAVTSMRLLEDLRRSGLAKKELDIQVASSWGEMEAAFQRLRAATSASGADKTRWKGLRDYLTSSTARERLEWAKSAWDGPASSADRIALGEAFDRMESWIRLSIERKRERDSARRLADYRERRMSAEIAKALLRKVGQLRTYHGETLPRSQALELAGYGVPLAQESDPYRHGRIRTQDREFARMAREAEDAVAALAEHRRTGFPDESRELSEVAANLDWIKKRIAWTEKGVPAGTAEPQSISQKDRSPASNSH